MDTRTFTIADQALFARLSGDRNPMHMDALAARRTQFGRPVVHGVHTLMWAIDRIAAEGVRPPGGLRVKFVKPVFLGESVTLSELAARPGQRRYRVAAGDVVILKLDLLDQAPEVTPLPPPAAGKAAAIHLETPRRLVWTDLLTQSGTAPLGEDGFAEAFPSAARLWGVGILAGLAATSFVVGMLCPGLHSIYSNLTVRLDGTMRPCRYRALALTEAFKTVEIGFQAPGLVASIIAMARTPPVEQPDMFAVGARVTPGAFLGQRALVIGGSRGLGEITAKIVSAGGGSSVVTYARGQADAQAVALAIAEAGGDSEILRYDAQSPAAPQLAALRAPPNAVYYFATNSIFRRKSALWEPAVMHEHARLYVDGLADLAQSLRRLAGGKLAVFYPSTVAVDEPVQGLAEYAAAKQAGETMCRYLEDALPQTRFIVGRLPRILTDQTATTVSVAAAAPLDVMIPIVQQMQTVISE